jgi:regulator of cell morphogenesis and NO signaling
MIDAKQTIGEIAGRHPSTIDVFEQLGIYYCCHGEQTLEAACLSLGLPVEGILSEIKRAIEANPPGKAPSLDPILESLMGRLLRARADLLHHDLPRIQTLVRTVSLCHLQEHPNAVHVARLAEILAHQTALHLKEEAQTLFPRIRELEQAYVGESPAKLHLEALRNHLAQMTTMHEEMGDLLSRIEELTSSYEASATTCASYRELCERLQKLDREIRQEVHLENNVLFRRTLQMSESLYGAPTSAH